MEWIDICKGIAIILVVFAHRPIPSVLNHYISSFHMPLFFFVSGYLFNDVKYNKDNFTFTKSRVKSLLVPYAVLSLLSYAIYVSVNRDQLGTLLSAKVIITKFFYLRGEVLWNGPLWFLFCLFVVSVGFFILNKLIKSRKLLLLSIMAFILIGYLTSLTFYTGKARLPFGLDIACTALVFYGAGYFLKLSKFQIRNSLLSFSIMLVCAGINFLLSRNNSVNMSYNIYGNYALFYINAILGIMTILILSNIIEKSRILSYLGRNSLIIMSMQFIVFLLMPKILMAVFHYSFSAVPNPLVREVLFTTGTILCNVC